MARGGKPDSGPSGHEIEMALRARVAELAPELLQGGGLDPTKRYFLAGSTLGGAGESLVLNLVGADRGLWRDFAAPEKTDDGGGDMLKLIAAAKFGGWSRDGAKAKAIAWAKSRIGLDDLDPERLNKVRREAAERDAAAAIEAERELAKKRRRAAWLWHGASPIAGTPALTYLVGRGIDFGKLGRIPNALRYHPQVWCPFRGGKHPAMVACIMGLNGELLGIHRTYLDLSAGRFGPVTNFKLPPDDRGRRKSHKLSLGHYQGGCVPLWKGESRATLRELPEGTPVYVSEGIEDGLSIAMGRPELRIVAGVALANIGGIELPPQAGPLVLIGQNDPLDSKAVDATEAAIARQQEAGRQVQTIFPPEGFKDFNDLLLGKRQEIAA